MGWKQVLPSAGGRRADNAVTLACRDNSGGKGLFYHWVITMTAGLARELNWGVQAFALVRLGEDEDAGKVMLIRSPQSPETWRYTRSKTSMQGALPIELRGTKAIGATRIPHEVVDGNLILHLPIWAGGKVDIPASPLRDPRGRAVTQPRQGREKPSPPPIAVPPPIKPQGNAIVSQATLEGIEKEDIREALMMVTRGDSTTSIMEHFGWTKERVDHMRRLAAGIPRRLNAEARHAGAHQ